MEAQRPYSFLVFGSWRIRHDEPLSLADERLWLYPLELTASVAVRRTLMLDAGDARFRGAAMVLGADGEPLAEDVARDEDTTVPLAIVHGTAPLGPLAVSHLTLRLDGDHIQLYRRDEAAGPAAPGPLWKTLHALNRASHLILANHECYYLKGDPDIELEIKLILPRRYSYLKLCVDLYAELAEGKFPRFSPQWGDEFQFWSYDNVFCEILPNATGDLGYVSAIAYSKRKARWSDPMWMFKKKIYREDSVERWERNYEDQRLEGDVRAALDAYFGYPTRRLPDWRRSRCDVAFESAASNIFMVNFDDCQVHDEPGEGGRLQQCEIEYLKTRGVPDRSAILDDFQALVAEVERHLARRGLAPQRSTRSKLTFLRERAAARGGGSAR